MRTNKRISADWLVIITVFAVLVLHAEKIKAQLNIPSESAKMQFAYKNEPYLAFNVKYTYAAETAPNTILDSVKGSFKMSGNYYWGSIDSLEFMQNSSYNIMLYKTEKLMRVANPETVYPQIINFPLFDSLIGKNNYSVSYTNQGTSRNLLFTFSNSSFPYKNFRIIYDTVTHFISQIVYTVNDEVSDYADSYNHTPSGGADTEFIIVTATFTSYVTSSFSTTIFNTGNYFIKSGTEFTPQPPFQLFEVFIASPNLLN